MESSYSTSDEQLNNGSTSAKQDSKKQQFTKKQRLDLYAFCVLELELHSHQVSVRRQQQAIERALAVAEPKRERQIVIVSTNWTSADAVEAAQRQQNYHRNNNINNANNNSANGTNSAQQNADNASNHSTTSTLNSHDNPSLQALPAGAPPTNDLERQQQDPLAPLKTRLPNQQTQLATNQNGGDGVVALAQQTIDHNVVSPIDPLPGIECKTLEQLQEELATQTRCYSDHQRTQVLTSSMLRDVQKRFAKYYPDSIIPSRTTIKHLFDKCVAHGTVDNIKTPKPPAKVPHCDQIEHLLIHEPQLSLRQMARRLNISVGTVSRRCKALGLVPDSVTIKHQQLTLARRRKHLKQLANKHPEAIDE